MVNYWAPLSQLTSRSLLTQKIDAIFLHCKRSFLLGREPLFFRRMLRSHSEREQVSRKHADCSVVGNMRLVQCNHVCMNMHALMNVLTTMHTYYTRTQKSADHMHTCTHKKRIHQRDDFLRARTTELFVMACTAAISPLSYWLNNKIF
jgi:hypothetical protein